MRFCANCRAQLFDAQCPKCGTDADAPIPENPKYGFGFEGASLKEHQAAALCYALWFVSGIALLFAKPYSRSRTVRFHAHQAIILTAFWMVLMLTVSVWVPLEVRVASFSAMWLFGVLLHIVLLLLTLLRFDPAIPLLSMMARKNL